jgi:hypothetical protein
MPSVSEEDEDTKPGVVSTMIDVDSSFLGVDRAPKGLNLVVVHLPCTAVHLPRDRVCSISGRRWLLLSCSVSSGGGGPRSLALPLAGVEVAVAAGSEGVTVASSSKQGRAWSSPNSTRKAPTEGEAGRARI